MVFLSWLARLRSSSIPSFYSSCSLRNSIFKKQGRALLLSTPTEAASSDHQRNVSRILSSWAYSLLPMALAASAGAVFIQSQNKPSLCDASNIDHRIGDKDSTGYEVKGSYRKVPQELIDELKAICQDNITMDYEERYFHGTPQHSFHKAVNVPDVVVYPRSSEEVSKIVKSCNDHKVPIVPYGGATSIEGHTLSPNGGVCIDMTQMNVRAAYLVH